MNRRQAKLKKSQFQPLNNKGMTLVELLTALVIVSILMVVMGYIFFSSMNYMTYFGGKRNIKQMTDSIMDYCKTSLTTATSICIRDEEITPEGWDEDDTDYICFKNSADGGMVHTKTISDFYGKSEYDGGKLVATIQYNNSVRPDTETGDTRRTVTISFKFFDQDGALVYKRTRDLDIINLSNRQKDITGEINHTQLQQETAVSNQDKDIYVYFTKKQFSEFKERDICTIFEDIFKQFTKDDKDFYKNGTLVNKYIDINGNGVRQKTNVGPVCNAHGQIMWQFRAMPNNVEDYQDWFGDWNTGSGTDLKNQSLLTMDSKRLADWGIPSLNGKSITSQTFYMVPYMYVNNTEKLDIIYYVYTTYYFDNILAGNPRRTQLIYNNEEDEWDYLPVGTSNANITHIYMSDHEDKSKEVNAFPVDAGTVVTYRVKVGEVERTYTMTIDSSYQIKMFFKKYGKKL